MLEYPCPSLEAFFSIPSREIGQDLERAVEGVDHIRWELSHLMAQAEDDELEDSARLSHLLIIQAYAMSRREEVPLEVKAHYAKMTAGLLGGDAEDSAAASPRGRKILSQIDEIERREGLTGEIGEPCPPEYRRLDDELGVLLQEAYDRVFLLVLRRYRMDELAALYESQPDEFSLLASIGSRLLHDSALSLTRREIADEDRYILKARGPAALRHLKQRVEELREQVGYVEGPWPIP